jgi:hypothetical protein
VAADFLPGDARRKNGTNSASGHDAILEPIRDLKKHTIQISIDVEGTRVEPERTVMLLIQVAQRV